MSAEELSFLCFLSLFDVGFVHEIDRKFWEKVQFITSGEHSDFLLFCVLAATLISFVSFVSLVIKLFTSAYLHPLVMDFALSQKALWAHTDI